MENQIRAIALISGGLDSILAARMISDQGIKVTGIYFSSPLWSSTEKEENIIKKISSENEIDIIIFSLEDDYIDMVRNPRHGKGKGINPCIDCKIFMLRKAKQIMEESDAEFIITGEVLGQRPMSQHSSALNLIEKKSGLKGRIVRPLSGKNLPPTEPEIKGLIDRDKLADIIGRGRFRQIEMVKKAGLKAFTSPAGGCLLTEKGYANKLRDFFLFNEKTSMKDLRLLKYGRHFRYKDGKIIVGRNKNENEIIEALKDNDDYCFDVPDIGSPVTLLQGNKDNDTLLFASRITALYSDSKEKIVNVRCAKGNNIEFIRVTPLTKKEADEYNLAIKGSISPDLT